MNRLRASSSSSSSPDSGFTLVEALIALALMAVALLTSLALVSQQRAVLLRLEAQERVEAEVSTALESLRNAAVPCEDMAWTEELRLRGFGAEPLRMTYRIRREHPGTPPEDLFHVRIDASWTLLGQVRHRAVETLLWRPDACPTVL